MFSVCGGADLNAIGGTDVSVAVGATAAKACGAGACAADIGAAALNAAGAERAANENNPLIKNVIMNKNVANADANRNTGTTRGVGGLTPAICGVRVKLRGAHREGS